MSDEGKHLDPSDWNSFGEEMHKLLDHCLQRMQSARNLPWQPYPENYSETIELKKDEPGSGHARAYASLVDDIMPYATGNTHPGFFGWVHGAGLPVSVGAEIVAATMNSNCGGRDHGAMQVEQAVLAWLLQISGLPSSASAILTSGTSQATILALSAAKTHAFGKDTRQTGIQSLPEVAVYLSEGAHSCIGKAMEILGFGSEALRHIPTDDDLRMDLQALKTAIERDRAAGYVPLAIVGTAGAVNTGAFDPIEDLADISQQENIWLHIDGAFGFWALLADMPWRALGAGIGRAHSIACDFHKWMSIPYDCGACMIHDRNLHLETFSSRPSYLAQQKTGLGGGEPWYCDFGIELSRGFRALKIWTAIKAIGMDEFARSITDNCRQAQLMGALADASNVLTLAHPVISNVCCFFVEYGDPSEIAARLQMSGEAVFSTTKIRDRSCLRAAIVNHRTTSEDIRKIMAAVEREVVLTKSSARSAKDDLASFKMTNDK